MRSVSVYCHLVIFWRQ